jgi:uncharacterized protein (DUF885 family)
MRVLAYHEAVPGHHYQVSIAQEIKGLPLFRRNVPFNAFIEGWGLYVERLADEQGWYPTPLERVGFLLQEIWR